LSASEHSYREQAKEHLAKAEALLASGDPSALRYACLELRMSIEATCTARLVAYREELGRSGIENWKPAQIIKELNAADPLSFVEGQLSFKVDGTEETFNLGTEFRFSAKWAAKAHNALSNVLHVPTIRQWEAGKKPNNEKIREIFEKYLPEVKKVLSSPVSGFKLTLPTFDFVCSCGFQIRRRMGSIAVGGVFGCGECGRVWEVIAIDSETELPEVKLREFPWTCDDCGTENAVPQHEIDKAYTGECSACKRRIRVTPVWRLEQI